jgi:quinol-cytochrome oxidoreductase complex cytochrome b subunit
MSFTRPRQEGNAGSRRDGADRENGADGANGRSTEELTERTGLMSRGPAQRDGHAGGNGRVDREKLKRGAAEVPISVVGWLDERAGMSPTLRAMLYRKVPKGTNWFYTLGSATMFAFVSQAVTGIFLAMYYDPSPVKAYESIGYITNEAFAGELVRGMHRWGSSVMVILVFMHMARTFFFGAYKYPRELNWLVGVVLLVLTLAMGFTGYLLPFDQRSYWATVVGVNIQTSAPFIGPYVADFLRAGPDFTATTLPRFYSLHMLLIPGLIGGLIGAHLYLVMRHGTTAPPWLRAEKKPELAREEI